MTHHEAEKFINKNGLVKQMLKIADNVKASIIAILQIFIKVKYSMRMLNRNVEGI